jgi:hypothetical protein
MSKTDEHSHSNHVESILIERSEVEIVVELGCNLRQMELSNQNITISCE